MSARTFILAHDMARANAKRAIDEAPSGYWVKVTEPKKRRIQEEKYHAMMGDIAEQCDYRGGRKISFESWKRLLVEAFVYVLRDEARVNGAPDPFPRDAELLASLDGLRIVQVEVLTRNFTVKQAALFIEYLYAFGSERGVIWSEPKERQAA